MKTFNQTLFFLISATLILSGHVSANADEGKSLRGEAPWIVLAHYEEKDDVLALKPYFDLWKLDEKNKTVLMVVEHQADYQELLTRGFNVEIHEALMDQQKYLKQKSVSGLKTITNFPCYRTVVETYEAMDAMALNYAEIVELVDIGDSWHKTEPNDGLPGHTMQVVKITNKNINTPNKPVLYAMGSIHSREYPPAELVTRFAEHILSNYGDDADVTWLVDHHEIHLLLQGNPDGRQKSETQDSPIQRKNRNENHCFSTGDGTSFSHQGVDMNRNFEFLWNQGSGSSSQSCSSGFRGLTPVSEPETEAINDYIKTIFPDQRPDDLVTPAPDTTTGVYLDIHNVAELTLFPWGYDSVNATGQAPNHDQLQTLARKMSFFTGYRPEQSNSTLGGADGASDDNAYGLLGVAAYTIELGENGFYSSCNAFENTIYPDNLQALIYAAKAARMPYKLASGPDVINLPTQAIQVVAGEMINVSGTATDLRFNNGAASTGNEPTQNISAVKAYLGTPSWLNGAVAINMTASDGNFNSTTEAFIGSIDSTGLSEGRYTIWFEAEDANETGVPAAIFVDVIDPANFATVSGVVTDAQTNAAIDMAAVSYDGVMTVTDNAGAYSIQTSATTSDLVVSKSGYFEQIINAVITSGGQTTTQNIAIFPTCETTILNTDVESFNSITDAVSAGWSIPTVTGNNDWDVEVGDNNTQGGSNAFVSENVGSVTDKSLITPTLSLVNDSELVFWHKHDFESGNANYDGGVIEITTNDGSSWTDLGSNITQNGYGGVLDDGFDNPLSGRLAFVDNLGTFTEVKVDLSTYAGQSVKIRWRMGTDNTEAAGDWVLDDILVSAAGVCEPPNDIIFANDFELIKN